MSVEDLSNLFDTLKLDRETKPRKMNADEISKILETAVRVATQNQKIEFDRKIEEISNKINSLTAGVSQVKTYEEARILTSIPCGEPLDVVKSLPEFEGKVEDYVSWRQAAHTAYKVFEKHDGSSKHYQALAIIRNKIRGPADAVLASFNTVLNFSAIIARLDFTYADKRPIYLIEQELSTLRQGSLSVVQFYEEVERKLSLLTNKTIMTYDKALAQIMNEKYRDDALRIFVSGLKKPLCDIIFSARPQNMPAALALAQEIEANHERYVFAATFANRIEGKKVRPETGKDILKGPVDNNFSFRRKNPFYERNSQVNQKNYNANQPEPMDIDPTSSRFRRPSNYYKDAQAHQFKRPVTSDRNSGFKYQRINAISNERDQYNEAAESECQGIEDEAAVSSDYVNFLEVGPCYRL